MCPIEKAAACGRARRGQCGTVAALQKAEHVMVYGPLSFTGMVNSPNS